MQEKLMKINYIQVALIILLFALIGGFITPENGLDLDATISKVAALIVACQLFTFASARHAILELEKLDLGAQLNRVFDTAKLIVDAVGSSEPAVMGSVTTVTTVNPPSAALPNGIADIDLQNRGG